jgi:hypothetical protein
MGGGFGIIGMGVPSEEMDAAQLSRTTCGFR